MRFIYNYALTRETLAADVQRFLDFLVEHDAEDVTCLEITCYPWRNDKRLQAVDSRGEIRPVLFNLEPGDERYEAPDFPVERVPPTIRERPDELGDMGFATWFNHDD